MSTNPLNDISKVYLEQVAVDEAVKGSDTEMRKAAAAERKAGDKPLSKSEGDKHAANMKRKIEFADKISKAKGHIPGYTYGESLDPVGQEDADVDNDGKKNTNADKYLIKRRKAIGKALATRKEEAEITEIHAQAHKPHEVPTGNLKGLVAKAVKRIDTDVDGDTDNNDKAKGELGEFVPGVGNKRLYSSTRPKTAKESFSNWRQDLIEVMDDVETNEKIKEKKINNKIKINPNLGEAVEELGGTLIEMVEVDEFDFIVEGAYLELLDEGYEEDEIEEALEYALTEAKVTFGHDTTSTEKKKEGLLGAARKRLAGAKASAKAAVARGARKVAKGALGVARKMEGGDKAPKTAERKPSTYRGAGAGTKERVSSGSYTAPTKKKAEKPADPWEGSATTPPKAKPKAATKKAAAPKPKAKAPAKKKKSSKLDDLLASVRSEETQIDEKTLTKMEMKKREEIVKSMKDKESDFEQRYPGRGREVMYATATKMAKKIAEQSLPTEAPAIDKKKEMVDKQKLANLKMLHQKKQNLERQRLQMQKSGKLPLEAN